MRVEGRVAVAVAAEGSVMVVGDHGHDQAGGHFPGLPVPTIDLYRGGRFQPGATLGPVPLTIHRYLLSWALGLPLAPAYRGAGAAEVLVGAPPPPAFVAPPIEIATGAWWKARLGALWPLVVALALVGAFLAWHLVARRPVAVVAAIGWGGVFVASGALLA